MDLNGTGYEFVSIWDRFVIDLGSRLREKLVLLSSWCSDLCSTEFEMIWKDLKWSVYLQLPTTHSRYLNSGSKPIRIIHTRWLFLIGLEPHFSYRKPKTTDNCRQLPKTSIRGCTLVSLNFWNPSSLSPDARMQSIDSQLAWQYENIL